MRGVRTLIICFLHVLSLHGVLGEGYHGRNRALGDRSKHEDNKNVVRDRVDAQFVLSKYGYLRCRVNNRKRRDVSTDYKAGIKVSEEGGADACDETEVDRAIREYQRTYNLSETGFLDEETKTFMSTSRCGNRDEEKAVTTEQQGMGVVLDRVDPNGMGDTNLEHKSRFWKRSTSRAAANSKLLNVLAGDVSRSRGLEAHKRHYEDYVKRLRKDAEGNNVFLHKYTPLERSKRAIHVRASNTVPHGKRLVNGAFFNKEVVKWRLLNTGYSTRIPVEEQRATIDLAFRMWSEVIPLRFQEDKSSHINSVDIEIAFGKGNHQNCDHDFDGSGGEIAHSWNVGNMHFDDQENFRSIISYSVDGIYLLRVVVHEIGHVLGLVHTNKTHSIMFAIYRGTQKAPQFELSGDDRKDMQSIYGVCSGKFDTVFDWVRWGADNHYIYNTYFFRDSHYWLYENFANRTRYGDPLYIAREWDGVPDNVDGYVHIWLYKGKDVINKAYFFKGLLYYKYDSSRDRVETGYPKEIHQDFGPKPGGHDYIPNNLNSVFFDARDKYLYFFKADKVYVYDPIAPPDERGCCVRIRKISEEFPPEEGHRPLPGYLDAVYYSYRDKMMYFLKGDSLWRNKGYDPRKRRVENRVEYMGPWQNKWFDICDVMVKDRL